MAEVVAPRVFQDMKLLEAEKGKPNLKQYRYRLSNCQVFFGYPDTLLVDVNTVVEVSVASVYENCYINTESKRKVTA